jgi:type I restriction enzyme, S subunit
VINDDFDWGNRYIDNEKFLEMGVYELFPGDIIITMMGTTGKSKVVPTNIKRGIIDSHLIRIRINEKTFSDFISLLINDSYYVFNQIKINSKGSIMEGLNSSIIKSLQIALPPLSEQQAIVDFLDRKTAQVDTLITKKQRQIELLQEQRTALINQAVTKGLNPAVPMKDSGVEWLGDIPIHWKTNKLSRIAEIKGRIGWRGYTIGDLRDKSDGVLVLGATHINLKGQIDISEPTYISVEKYEESPEIKLFGEEILMVKVGATVGKVGFVPKNLGEATINPNVMIVRNSLCSPKFLFYFLKCLGAQISISLAKNAGAQDAINQSFVGTLRITIPPEDEQQKIVSFLDEQLQHIDELVEKLENQINNFQEYRTALISETVTGKIDVRTTG